MSNIPSDVITDILSRLPVKSLLRFRCVSKPWSTLIDGPDFITLHLNRSIRTNTAFRLIIPDRDLYSVDFDKLDTLVELDHPLKTPQGSTDVLGSCNGLLCLTNSDEGVVMLWNPSTRTHHFPPVTPIEFPDSDFLTCVQFIVFGFGYDHVNDDYKVVRVVQFYSDPFDSEVKVYSLKTNSWRRVLDCPYCLQYKRAWGIFASGALHWVACREPESDIYETDSSNLIIAFDLGVEEFRIVPQPNFLDEDFYMNVDLDEEFHMNVDVLEGCLCLICNYVNVCVDIWVMKDYGVKESWTKLFSVAQAEVSGSFQYVIPIAFSKSGSEVLLGQDGKKLIWYDVKNKRVKNVVIPGLPDLMGVQMCLGSLLRLNGDYGNDGKKQQSQKKKKKKKNKKKRDDFLLEGSKLVLNFPTELITEILSFLPVKTLLRFKTVSKPWCTLINNPDFIKRHLKRSIESHSNLSLILRHSHLYSVDFGSLDNAVELEHPLKSEFYGTDVLGSCNGVLCLYNSEEEVALWNVSTRKCQKLPESPGYFAFCQYIIYGFGYDFINDDYKVVRIVQFYGKDADSFDSEVKIYSLKTNSWRRIQDFPYYLRYKRGWGMFAGGALHWVATRTPESKTSNLIVAFDLGVEECQEVSQPKFLDKNFHMNLGVLGGCLCILANYHKVRVDIWVMKDYGVKESWTKLFSVAQPKVIRSFEYVRPLAYSKSSNEVLLEQDNKKLLWYDINKNKVKNVRIRGVPESFDAEICIGSLVSLNAGSEIDRKKLQAQDKKKNRKKRDDFLSEGFKLVL